MLHLSKCNSNKKSDGMTMVLENLIFKNYWSRMNLAQNDTNFAEFQGIKLIENDWYDWKYTNNI